MLKIRGKEMGKKVNFVIALFLLIIFAPFLSLGPRIASDYHYIYPETLKSLFAFPYIWSTKWGGGLGHYVSSSWAWPFEVLYGLLGVLGFSFDLIERLIIVVLIIVLGSISINKLLSSLKVGNLGKLVGSAFFLSNSYLILLIDGGQLNLAVGYSLLPLAYIRYREAIKGFSLRRVLNFILVTFAVSAIDLRVVVLLGFLILLSFTFDLFWERKSKWPKILKKNIFLGAITVLLLALFNLYWILPILVSRTNAFIPTNYSNVSQINFLSFSNLANGLFFQQPHWYENDFGKISQIKVEFLLIPLVVMLSPLIIKRDKRVSFWFCAALVFIFLSKGVQEPFPQINRFLFERVPIFVLFRDPTKFYFLVALSYAVLISISIEGILDILERYFRKINVRFVLTILGIGYFFFLNWPVLGSKMNGLFSLALYEGEYKSLAEGISEDKGFGRVVWIPTKHPLGFESPDHPAVDAFSLLERRPFAIGTKGSYERLNFFREATFSGELLNVAGVKSIVYPPLDYRKEISEDQSKYYSIFLNQLKFAPYIKEVNENFTIPKLDLKEYQQRFFIPKDLYWVVGDDGIYSESTKSAKLGLDENALVFAEEKVGLGERIRDVPFAKVILRNKEELDFRATFLRGSELIFPALKLRRDPDESGFWKRETSDLISWRDFLLTKYGIANIDFDFGGGWAVGEGSLALRVTDKKISKDKVLLVRVMESTRGGQINFYQGPERIGGINTKRVGDNLRWFEVGKIKSSSQLDIQTEGDINVINALAIVDSGRWLELKGLSEGILQKQLVGTYGSDEEDEEVKVEINRINQTEYKVNFSGVKKEQLVVFSESYSPLWKMGEMEPLPIYSFLNGFVVSKDGEYTVKFWSQEYVKYGLVVSIFTLFLVFYLLRKSK